MTGTNGEEAIVLESKGRKRANEEKDSRLAKRVKVEGEAAGDGTKEEEGKVERLRRLLADDPKMLSRKNEEEVINCLNVEEIISLALEPRQGKGSDDDGEKCKEGAIVLESEERKRANEDNDSWPAERVKVEGEEAGDGTKEEEGKVERLRRLLADDPKKLSRKDEEEVINCLNVEEIISLALESRQGKGGDDDGDGEKWKEGEEWCVKALGTVRLMLGCIGVVKTGDIRLVYEKWPPKAFATVLLSALDFWAAVRSEDPLERMEYYDIIPKLCGVLPFKLFAHVLDEKDLHSFLEERDEEETRRLQKEAADGCGFCFGKAEHTGIDGEDCTLMGDVPIGTWVPAGYWIECDRCGEYVRLYDNIFEGCIICDCQTGKAVPIPPFCLEKEKMMY